MITLKTNYKDAVLNAEENAHRKFSKTDNPDGTGNGGSGDSQTSDQNKDNGKAEQTKAAVQTGDTANPWGYGVAITLSLAVILVVLKRRFKNV